MNFVETGMENATGLDLLLQLFELSIDQLVIAAQFYEVTPLWPFHFLWLQLALRYFSLDEFH